ncbi:MAG: zinc-dependent alcohol dehydrogenase family protein [Actinomycetales bacterium]|nr:zinc-dependent alcohol dehydrogenase family protein [Actinomycetales bacterium]
MRAVQFASFGGPISLADVPDPVPPADGVVIQVEATGLCRSDWHGWQGHDPDITALPHTPGHELAGCIVAVGDQVRLRAVGERVTVPFVCGCGSCPQCLSGNAQVCPRQWQPGFSGPGSFAEFVAIPRADFNVVPLSASVSMDAAAGLGCRFATAYRAVAGVGDVQAGETAIVFGCGGVGLSIVMVATARGACVIAVDANPDALALAQELGAAHALHADDGSPMSQRQSVVEAIRELIPPGADVTFDALGSIDTCHAAVESLRPRGRHVQVGLLPPAEIGDRATVPMHRVIGLELSILGSHGMAARDYPQMLALVADGTCDPLRLVTRRIGLDEVPAALAGMATHPHPGVTIIRPRP